LKRERPAREKAFEAIDPPALHSIKGSRACLFHGILFPFRWGFALLTPTHARRRASGRGGASSAASSSGGMGGRARSGRAKRLKPSTTGQARNPRRKRSGGAADGMGFISDSLKRFGSLEHFGSLERFRFRR
jgi:hypothetical protein